MLALVSVHRQHALRRLPRHYFAMGQPMADAQSDKPNMVPVSAHDAAAWLTGKPAYDTEWPECKGMCLGGVCALRFDTPACCYVPHPDHESQYRDGPGRPYAAAAEQPRDGDMPKASFSYWRSRDWYCRR